MNTAASQISDRQTAISIAKAHQRLRDAENTLLRAAKSGQVDWILSAAEDLVLARRHYEDELILGADPARKVSLVPAIRLNGSPCPSSGPCAGVSGVHLCEAAPAGAGV